MNNSYKNNNIEGIIKYMTSQYTNKNGKLYFIDSKKKRRQVYNNKGKPSTELKKSLLSGHLKTLPTDFEYVLDVSKPDNKRFIRKDKIFKNKGKSKIIKKKYLSSNVTTTKQGLTKIKKVRSQLKAVEKKAMKGYTRTISYDNTKSKLKGILTFKNFSIFTNQLVRQVRENSQTVVFRARVSFINPEDNLDVKYKTITIPPINFLNTKDIKVKIRDVIEKMKAEIPEVQLGKDYKFHFGKVESYEMSSVNYKPLRGGSFIDLPDWIKNKKAVINPKNDDNECFKWSIICSLNKGVKDLQRLSKLKKIENTMDYLAFDKLTYPYECTSTSIKRAENVLDLSISVFDVQGKTICPLFTSRKQAVDDKCIDLLLLWDPNTNKKHYCSIKDLSKLVGSQINTHKEKKHICRFCLHGFQKKETLEKHLENGCAAVSEQRVEMPVKGENDVLKFKNFPNKFKCPFVIYADFESFLQPVASDESQNSYATQKHVPSGFTIKPVSAYDDIKFDDITYHGDDVIKTFCEQLAGTEKKIFNEYLQKYKDVDKMKITPTQQRQLKTAKCCSICEQKFEEGDKRVRDHDHTSGKFRGIAHEECNINCNLKNFKIPVVFHNLKGYDSHFIISQLDKDKTTYIKVLKDKEGNVKCDKDGNEMTKETTSKIDCIPQNSEKFVTFSYKKLKFIDSMSFLSSSLEKLVENTYEKGKGKELFKLTRAEYVDDEQFNLLMRKGVFPYSYMDGKERFKETTLPSKEHFKNDLNETEIKDEDYAHAQKVWKVFKCKTLADYHDVYMKSDVYLLADVFENFRNVSMTSHRLDPIHYLSLPGYSWDCMLHHLKIELKLLTDLDEHLFLERGIRGGVSMIAHRHAEANNKYMITYDKEKNTSYIMYWDANNLYGLSMSEHLPTESLGFLSDEDVATFDLDTMNSDDKHCYTLEVDLEYPKELHDLHNCLPVAPERMNVSSEMYSSYQTHLAEQLKVKDTKVEKLVPNLNDKKNYVVHSKNLEYYIKLGLKVKKIHKVLKMKQSKWLKEYIDLNTGLRKKAKNDFEKDFYKLMNNAVFGKTMENVRNRIELELVTDHKRMEKLGADPRLKNINIIREQNNQENDEGLVSVERKKNVVKLNKPIYAGFSILELSKLHMYKFHYDHIKPKYDDKAKLLFTDTDSLCYHIQTDDVYADMVEDKDLFDLSNYADAEKTKFVYDTTNKKVLGKFKDETEGIPITEFVGIRSKMYSLLIDGNKEKKTGKGIKKYKLKNDHIRHADYKRCVYHDNKIENMRQNTSFLGFRSKNHEVHTMKYNKISLNAFDDKRHIYDGVSSHSYGHYKTNNNHPWTLLARGPG